MSERPSVPLSGVGDDFDDEFVDDEVDDEDPGAECGRWDNGQLTNRCAKAGSEDCDFECPYRDGLYRTQRAQRKERPELGARDPRTRDMFEDDL